MKMQAGIAPAAFWLLPCTADADRLREVILSLARAHGSPAFEPHVTLHVAECPAAADIEGVLARVAQTQPPLALAALATGHSDAYYKALFVEVSCELQDGPGLVTLRRALVGQLVAAGDDAIPEPEPRRRLTPAAQSGTSAAPASYPFHPHVSLLYGELPARLRAELASHHDLHGHTFRFDRIAAVRPAPDHHDLAKVSHWEVYGHRRLADPPRAS
jgi:Cyclic phosphodiesterase-like protein